MSLERTFGMIKPDAVSNGYTGDILNVIRDNGFRVLGMKLCKINQHEAEAFYEVHKQRPFYSSLVQFMSSGPAIVMVLEREDAITKWRDVMGATNPAEAKEGTIRKRFAESIERNAVHGSDGPQTAAQEVPFFFSAAELL
jgi:nucleoside-diphosphate kinase